MIKVLDKTFALLERVTLLSGEKPCRINELAADLDINAATCARILRELCEAGYLTRISRADGYTVGPRTLVLGGLANYHERIMGKIRPVVDRISAEYHASVLYAELSGTEKYILYHRNHSRCMNIRMKDVSSHEHFQTATGLVFLAFSPDREKLLKVCTKRSPDLWFSKGKPESFLNRIAADGGFVHLKEHEGQGIMAFPVWENDRLAGVLGSSAEIEYFDDSKAGNRLVTAVRNGAKEITKSISYVERM